MNPYPFALLNHFTVPFRRSTCPPRSAGSRKRWKNSRDRKIMHALCGGRGVLSRKHSTKTLEFGLLLAVGRHKHGVSAALSALLCKPEDASHGFAVPDREVVNHFHDLREREKSCQNSLILFGLGDSSLQVLSQIYRHGLVEKSWAHIKVENFLPAARRVAGLFQQFAFGGR